MSPAEALARRAAACPAYRLVEGMLLAHPWGDDLRADRMRVLRIEVGGAYCVDVSCLGFDEAPDFWPTDVLHAGWLPDLADPATLGALLALVRERYPDAYAAREGRSWWVHDAEGTPLCALPGAYETRQRGESCCVGGPCHRPAAGATEAEALVLALEAAGVPDAR